MTIINEVALYARTFGHMIEILGAVLLIGLPAAFIGALVGWKLRKHKEPALLSEALHAKMRAEADMFDMLATKNRAARLIHSAETMDQKAIDKIKEAEVIRRLAAEILKTPEVNSDFVLGEEQ